jgi:hypothetical protein
MVDLRARMIRYDCQAIMWRAPEHMQDDQASSGEAVAVTARLSLAVISAGEWRTLSGELQIRMPSDWIQSQPTVEFYGQSHLM